jgi:hypothetical protein
MPALGRPTQATDEVPLFNFDEYFVGKWTFECDVPESPLGAGGKITGTTVYKPIEGAFYAADTEASGPTGSFKVREVYAYHKQNKTITRQVADSRNLSYLQLAAVGGDLGGLYNIYYESQPFTFKGKTFRMRERLSLTSPVAYRATTTLSVDGGPFVNYGTRWVSKHADRESRHRQRDRMSEGAGCRELDARQRHRSGRQLGQCPAEERAADIASCRQERVQVDRGLRVQSALSQGPDDCG